MTGDGDALTCATPKPQRRIDEIVLGKLVITADTGLQWASYLGLSEEFFLRPPVDNDLRLQHSVLRITFEAIKSLTA